MGGGLTGAGVARDLMLRGVSVLLLEKGDWGGGGFSAVQLAGEEGGHVARIARHLVHRHGHLLPLLPGDRYDFEGARLTGDQARRLEPGLSPAVTSAVAWDEWAVDPHRLAWANVLDAIRSGAAALNHAEVVGLLREGGAVTGVRYRAPDGQRVEARSRVVVNTAGPWAPAVAALAGAEVRLRPTRSVHVVFDRRISNVAISAEAIDGRPVVLAPLGSATLLGAAEADHFGDLDALEARPDEVDYLLQATERVFPAIREHRAVRAVAGVRAAPFVWGRGEDERFEVIDGVPGLVTVAGGEPSMYRLMAERIADAVCARLGVRAPSATATRALPGASGTPPTSRELAAEHGITALAAARLLGRHGTEAPAVLQDPRRGRLACRCEAVTEAELVHAVRHEQVRTLADGFRRLGVAAGPCAGMACVERAGEVIGRELGWSPGQRLEACRAYQVGAWRGRAPVLDRWGWAQEELAYGARRGWPGGL